VERVLATEVSDAVRWSVDLCQGWLRIGQLQGDAFEFRGVARDNELGEWTLTFPVDAPSWSHYINVAGDVVAYNPRDVDTVRLVEDGELRFPGFVGEPSQGTGASERIMGPSGVRWSMSGPDIWDILRRRIAFPQPSQATPSSWATSHDVNSGQASTVLATYLSDNLGPTALAARQIPGLTIVDTSAGPTSTWSARCQSVYELARRILADSSLTIRWSVAFDGDVTATIRQPSDFSEVHVLSDQDDLTRVRSRRVPARSTWVLAGGDGTGTGRTFRVSTSGVSGLNRRERFVSVSSLSEDAEVQSRATAELALDAETWVVSGEVADSVTERIGFGRTVFCGDKVTIQTQAQRFVVPVASIAYHISAERQVIRPTLGEAVPDPLAALRRRLDRIERQGDNGIS
jgi:ReqiPepy6 Gp37-like protein